MNLTYRIKLFVETLEDYKVGLEGHLYSQSAERESPSDLIEENGGDILMQEYKLPKNKILEINDEIGRVRLFIDVFNKFLDEPSMA